MEESAEQLEIIEERPDHHYRTEIPNFIFDVLNPTQLAVYCHLKRVIGDGGKCWMSTKNLSKKIGIGVTLLKQTLKELAQKDYFIEGSLIRISARKKSDGARDTNIIKIVDVWRINGDWHRGNKPKGGGSPNDGGVGRQTTGGGSPNDHKEQPSEEEPSKETNKQEDPKSEPVVVCSSDEESEKERMLRSYGMSTNLIANFIHLPISQLQDAIGAFEQYKSKQEESGGKLENPIGALRTAIEKNWKPNVSKADKENLREQDLMKKDDIIKSNKQFAINLYHDNMELFKDNFNFKVSDNIVTCKNGFGYHPLSLLDENFRGILSNYVKNQGFR